MPWMPRGTRGSSQEDGESGTGTGRLVPLLNGEMPKKPSAKQGKPCVPLTIDPSFQATLLVTQACLGGERQGRTTNYGSETLLFA